MSLAEERFFPLKTPHGLTPRIQRLRDFYFEGVRRPWNNAYTCWTTGTPWDVLYDEITYYIVPETYPFFAPFRSSALQAARAVELPDGFWGWSLPERRAWFIREVMVNRVPREILPGDLLAGARFNILASRCWTRSEARRRNRQVRRARRMAQRFHQHGYGNAGATSGHLVPDYARVLREGWVAIHDEIDRRLAGLSRRERRGRAGAQLRAMRTAATMPRELARGYAATCRELAAEERSEERRQELEQMASNLDRVPWQPPRTFWEAVQALWLTHMLVMSDENYPGPGVSFGRLDVLLAPFWERSRAEGMSRAWGKEILLCFWVHANTAYDAMIRVGGNQGITSGFGQLFNVAGLGEEGEDVTGDLTFVLLEVIDEMSPILEPKPNVRLHRGSPDALLDKVVDMVASSQGSPFLLNFDERSMAGLLRQARRAGVEHLIHEGNVHDYVAVGCLENTMPGNDRSGTVDINLNLLLAVELVLGRGRNLAPPRDPVTGSDLPHRRHGPDTGDLAGLHTWGRFWMAYARQTRHLLARSAEVYEASEAVRAAFSPTPYLSCLVRGCASQARDITEGGAELGFTTVEGVTFATTVDSLLAIKYLVYDEGHCTLVELAEALRCDWEGHEALRARARHRAPKYGRNDPQADTVARAVMDLWTEETWRHRTDSTDRQFRPGMLSWNYWIADADLLAASADGRSRGRFLSNAICPSNGADTRGPTANTNSVGEALGGRDPDAGDWQDYRNALPNGASHTLTFHPQLFRDPAHRERFKAFLRGYAENGGTALQLNVVDADLLREAQAHPEDHAHLLVRVTGYNAYFTAIGRELQDEIIARESHRSL